MLNTCTKYFHTSDLKDSGGFTITWSFIAMFEKMTVSMSHMVCLIWKFSRDGRRATFLSSSTNWHANCKRLFSSIKNAHFKEILILISQYNNSLRVPRERYAKKQTKIRAWNQRIVNQTNWS